MNPLLQGHSGTTPETSQNMFSINQGTKEDDSQSNPHPEAGLLTSDREDRHDIVTGVQRERKRERERGRESSWPRHGDRSYRNESESLRHGDRSQRRITYCSPSTSSGKQKKNRSTSQTQFRSENTPVTIEADQNLLALQQLANNNNSANFQNNINRISKLPKSLTTTMPTFDGNSEKFELFEDLF